MGIIKIKKVKSEINRPSDQKKTLLALGLKKIGQEVELKFSPTEEKDGAPVPTFKPV